VSVAGGARKAEILDVAAEVFATSGIRASLNDIANASGIFAGSLYHHFDSKEAIVVELVRRYQAELEDLAAQAVDVSSMESAPLAAISGFGTAIAECAVRNRAAVLLSFYDPPSGSSPELVELVARAPVAITAAMHELLRRADRQGALRDGIDLRVLADRLCQSMVHVGIGVYHRSRGAERVPALKCQMLLDGVAARSPADSALTKSAARRAADGVVESWGTEDGGGGDRTAVVLAAARAEFGRRGYEATTVRDVAAAAGISPGAVYRVVDSKEQLLGLILSAYVTSVTEGWNAVLRSRSTPVEKLDALLWLDICVLDRFSEEHRIQSVSLQAAPPDSPNLGLSFPSQLAQMRRLLAEGEKAGELRRFEASADLRVRCAFSLIWTPENIIGDLGTERALTFARETFVRGAAVS
jgi:AcrR family transcriptional regulator